MRDISIRAKLYGVLALFLVSLGGIWAMTFSASRQVGEYLNPGKVEAMREAEAMRRAMEAIERNFNAAVQEKDVELLAECDAKSEVFLDALNTLTALDPPNRAEYLSVRASFDAYFRSAKAVAMILIREDIYNREINTHAEVVKRALPGLEKGVESIANRNYEAFTGLLERATTLTNSLVRENSMVLFILLAVSAVIHPLIIRTITSPLAKLALATKQIAGGNLDVKAEVRVHDEIGDLAVSFNEMTAALREKSAALRKTTEELSMVNAELKEADRLKSDFLASVSHELRTPLNAIINFSEMILEDWDQMSSNEAWAGEARDMLGRSLQSSRRLLVMINDLLDLAKIEAGHMGLALEEADLNEVASDALATVSPLARGKNLPLTFVPAKDLPLFPMDEGKSLQILINLLSNAVKFTDSGSVTLQTLRSPDGLGALARVADTGIGISREDQAIIFDRFRQAEGADSRKYSGAGLGLNLARNLAHLCGGWISVESEKNKGSTFTLFLPFRAARTGGHARKEG
jgi:signal transduction histidine kinase